MDHPLVQDLYQQTKNRSHLATTAFNFGRSMSPIQNVKDQYLESDGFNSINQSRQTILLQQQKEQQKYQQQNRNSFLANQMNQNSLNKNYPQDQKIQQQDQGQGKKSVYISEKEQHQKQQYEKLQMQNNNHIKQLVKKQIHTNELENLKQIRQDQTIFSKQTQLLNQNPQIRQQQNNNNVNNELTESLINSHIQSQQQISLPLDMNLTQFDNINDRKKSESEFGLDFENNKLPYRLFVITKIRQALIEEIIQYRNGEANQITLKDNNVLIDMIRRKVIPEENIELYDTILNDKITSKEIQDSINELLKSTTVQQTEILLSQKHKIVKNKNNKYNVSKNNNLINQINNLDKMGKID